MRLTIEEALACFDRLQHIDLLVIDTARKFFTGNEDDSGAWDPIFSLLMAWAEKRDCCVIVTHHTKRCGAIRNLKQLEELIRGSSIIIQRPRFAVGQFELNGSDVGVGFMKFSLPPSAGEPFSPRHVHKVFRRVAETLSLEPVDTVMAATPPAAATHAAAEQDRAILAALQTVAAEGAAVFRTGAKSLYAMKRPELEGMSRRALEAAIGRLFGDESLVGPHIEQNISDQPATHQGKGRSKKQNRTCSFVQALGSQGLQNNDDAEQLRLSPFGCPDMLQAVPCWKMRHLNKLQTPA